MDGANYSDAAMSEEERKDGGTEPAGELAGAESGAAAATEKAEVAEPKSQTSSGDAETGSEPPETTPEKGGGAGEGGATEGEVEGGKAEDGSVQVEQGTPGAVGGGDGRGVEGGDGGSKEQSEISYDYEELKSRPEVVNMPPDTFLELHHSFGYECQKRSNLVVLDKDMVAFSAGNLVQLLNLSSLQQTCLRTLGGGGIGALAVHPSRQYLAVGEKGSQPVLAIYTYPQLQLHRILRGGTEEMYSHMDFSSGEGELLASVGGYPDFMLTVWDWRKESTVLRSKAFSQDVYRVSFSPDNPGQLTTSGTGHIRFWKMATTFTGLKLQGQLGKFGRTELTDIAAYVELPDGKVLSGTEWGNMLLWDGGFIKVEISRKNKKFCHHGMIEDLFLDEGELISTGVDGYVRMWDFETIDNADITDENAAFEMDPLTEIRVGHDVCLKGLARSADPETPTLWYAQDAAGAIWKIDITASHTRQPPERLVSYHSGPVCGLSPSPAGRQAASIGHDGSVRVYDLANRELLCHTHFSGGGASLLWAPPTVESPSITLLAGFRDGVMRVLHLEQSKKRRKGAGQEVGQSHQLTLLHACKPHTKPLTCLAVDAEGRMLATGGADCTVFFLHISEKYRPIGFICTPAPVTSLQWSPPGKRGVRVLACCEDGSMVEAISPLEGDYDISKTFHLEPLPCSTRTFTSIKDRLRTEEEEARLAAEREKQRREKEAAKQRRRERLGDDYVSEDEEEEEGEVDREVGEGDEGEAGEEEEQEEKPKGPSPILAVFHSSEEEGEFWVSMGGYDAGYLYRCSMEGAGQEPEPYEAPHSIPVPAYNGRDLPLHSVAFSGSGQYLLTGSSNGMLRVHALPPPAPALSSLSSYWALSMHDNHTGTVSHLCITCDDQYVVSAGEDGNIFVYSASLPTASHDEVALEPLEAPPHSKSAKDIEDPHHYSIEDAKQKAEHDRRVKQAEMKKQSVRRDVGRLRRTFLQLVQRNAQLALPLQLPANEFTMDPTLESDMKERAQQQLQLVRREMAWEAEKHAIALDKLHTWFKAVVECERVVVWSFEGTHCVSSYRMPRPSPQFQAQLERELSSQHLQTPWTAVWSVKRVRSLMMKRREKKATAEANGKAEGAGHEQEGEGKLSKREARRLHKERRKKEWEELLARKPDKGVEDSEEATLVQKFKMNMGDYKLKTASDYVVPKHQRVTFSKKKRSLLLLRNKIFQRRREYNSKLLGLRDRKLAILDKMSAVVAELKSVQSRLLPSLRLPLPAVPTLRPEEVPERQREYSKQSLLQFAAEKDERERAEREAAAGVGEGFGGFGGFGGGGEKKEEGSGKGEEGKKENENGKGEQSEDQVGETGEGEAGSTGSSSELRQQQQQQQKEEVEEEEEKDEEAEEQEGEEEVSKKDEEEDEGEVAVQLSELGSVAQKEEQVQLLYRQSVLLRELEEARESLDEALLRLRHEKIQLDCTSLAASLKHITQFQELTLLREFEQTELTYTSCYRAKKQERQEMDTRMEELGQQLREREKRLAQLQEQEKALTAQVLERVGENKFKDFLLKVFRKKIKRAKPKAEGGKKKGDGEGGAVEEEDEDSDQESDSDFLSSSEEESEVGEEGALDDSVCPAGCDPALFSLACSLRETRLDVEEALVEEKRAAELGRKELEAAKKKLKTVDAHVKTAQSELEAFQLKKQQKLNELDQVVVLRLHQILHHGGQGRPPTTTAPCLVFPAAALTQLSHRIEEVKEERRREKLRYRELHQQHVRLLRERRDLEGQVRELAEKVRRTMTLKFGRVVDLDQLEGVATNRISEELRSRLNKQESDHRKELAALQSQVQLAKRQLVGVVRENTQQLTKLHDLLNTQDSLETRLNARQKSLRGEVGGAVEGEEEERERLQQLTSLQTQEISALKQEIRVLSTKGGKILPPSQPPVGPPPPGVSPIM